MTYIYYKRERFSLAEVNVTITRQLLGKPMKEIRTS